LNTITTTPATPVTDMPVIDSPLDPEVAESMGDEMLLGVAAATKVKRVRRGERTTINSPRAWTQTGRLD
jgi:hypothetical protein